MTPVVFINCSEQIFIDLLLSGEKVYETRNQDVFRGLVRERVLLAETGRGKPVVRCAAIIAPAIECSDRNIWDGKYRGLACIEEGSKYDWNPGIKTKYCYPIIDVHPVRPFILPEGIRHGRTWMEYNGDWKYMR